MEIIGEEIKYIRTKAHFLELGVIIQASGLQSLLLDIFENVFMSTQFANRNVNLSELNVSVFKTKKWNKYVCPYLS